MLALGAAAAERSCGLPKAGAEYTERHYGFTLGSRHMVMQEAGWGDELGASAANTVVQVAGTRHYDDVVLVVEPRRVASASGRRATWGPDSRLQVQFLSLGDFLVGDSSQ